MSNTASTSLHGFLRAVIPWGIVMIILVLAGISLHLITGVAFKWGILFFGAFFAGMGGTFLFGLIKGWTWIEKTPVYKNWQTLLGDKFAKPLLFILMTLIVMVGTITVTLPAFMGKPQPKVAQEYPLPNLPIVRPKGPSNKSRIMDVKDPAYVETIKKELQSEQEHNEAFRSMLRGLSHSHTPQKTLTELNELLFSQFKTADLETQRYVASSLNSFGTKADIPKIEKLIKEATDDEVKKQAKRCIEYILW